MQVKSGRFRLLRSALIPALCLLVVGYFAGHSLFGTTGVSSLPLYRERKATLQAQVRALDARKSDLERHVALLDPEKVDSDFAEELVRENLGLVRSDELVLSLNQEETAHADEGRLDGMEAVRDK